MNVTLDDLVRLRRLAADMLHALDPATLTGAQAQGWLDAVDAFDAAAAAYVARQFRGQRWAGWRLLVNDWTGEVLFVSATGRGWRVLREPGERA